MIKLSIVDMNFTKLPKSWHIKFDLSAIFELRQLNAYVITLVCFTLRFILYKKKSFYKVAYAKKLEVNRAFNLEILLWCLMLEIRNIKKLFTYGDSDEYACMYHISVFYVYL